MNIWDRIPESKPFIGILQYGGQEFYMGFLYPGRNYGVVITANTSGVVSIVSRYNGVFAWQNVDRTVAG